MTKVCEGECVVRSPGDEPLTLTSCHRYMNPVKGGNLSVVKPTT